MLLSIFYKAIICYKPSEQSAAVKFHRLIMCPVKINFFVLNLLPIRLIRWLYSCILRKWTISPCSILITHFIRILNSLLDASPHTICLILHKENDPPNYFRFCNLCVLKQISELHPTTWANLLNNEPNEMNYNYECLSALGHHLIF